MSLLLLFVISVAFLVKTRGIFVPVCPERCAKDDFFRSHPQNIYQENVQWEKTQNVVGKIRIAFVFAGTPRSLIFPPVHESIRENLLGSFCPEEYCIADAFIRVSMSDNTHSGLDSMGTLTKGDPELIPKVKYAISRLNPHEGSLGGVTEVDWTDIGSEKERKDMLASPFNSQRHRVIRTLDPRRYSMYFNRWSAYQLAMRREVETGKRYNWVVHVRLDSAWGEPVRAARDWSHEYVYVPDTWWSDVPDTFALLPRKWSDKFFDVEPLIDPSAMCLGGPNFDPLVMKEEYLRQKGFNDSDIHLANAAMCLNYHKGGPVTYQNHPTLGRIPWSDEGYSERILKRKLAVNGISLNLGTLIMHPFFVAVTRLRSKEPGGFPMCNFLGPSTHIGWIRTRQSVSHAQYFGCREMFDQLYPGSPTGYTGCSNLPSFVGSAETCLLDRTWSDWNFLPFRIRHRAVRSKLCISIFSNGTIGFEPCKDYHAHDMIPNINISYAAWQFFQFSPLRKGGQQIKNLGITDSPDGKNADKITCMTAVKGTTEGSYYLQMLPCVGSNSPSIEKNQRFYASWRPSDFPEVITTTKHRLPSASIMMLKWKDHSEIEYCMAVQATLRELGPSKPLRLILQNCNEIDTSRKGRAKSKPSMNMKSEFILEKTFTEGPTVSPLFAAAASGGKTGPLAFAPTANEVTDNDGSDVLDATEDINVPEADAADVENDGEGHVASTRKGKKRSRKSKMQDLAGLINELKTDDISVSESPRKRKGKGKGKLKGKGKTKGKSSSSSSALLPQKRQGKRGQQAAMTSMVN